MKELLHTAKINKDAFVTGDVNEWKLAITLPTIQ